MARVVGDQSQVQYVNTITSMLFTIPMFIAFQRGNILVAVAILFICLTSILNHGSDHQPVLQNLDYAAVQAIGTSFVITSIVRHSVFDIAALGIFAFGFYNFYIDQYRMLDSITEDTCTSHSAIHLCAIAGFTLFAIN